MQWRDAIISVLRDATGPMHYGDITDQIINRGFRPEGIGATPARTVSYNLTTSINSEGYRSPFIQTGRGIYFLREKMAQMTGPATGDIEETTTSSPVVGVINAFGMFWERSKIIWKNNPRVLGQQQGGSMVDFCQEKGVYLLHDLQGVVYVGRTTDQSLGQRLYQHTFDRLNGRWTRFSWFGVFPVSESGPLETTADFRLNIDLVVATMEAVLIEGLEPRQNRRRGDEFNAREFLQIEDPNIEVDRRRTLTNEIMQQVLSAQVGSRT
jgi:hypothetical protein